jgi:hypothetical protein
MKLDVAYRGPDTGKPGKLSLTFLPNEPEGRELRCPGFAFGSASHPDDFRCQICHHFAWDGHAPEKAWFGSSDAAECLAIRAMETILSGATDCSPDMAETLRAWKAELRKQRKRPLTPADEAILDRWAR